VTPSATTNYWVRATSSCGRTVDSNTATVTICSAPAITTQPPSNTNSYAGYNVNVSVQATGSNLTYQWYKGESGDMSTPVDGRDATGTTTATMSYYLQTSVRVWVRVTGQCGAVNSNAVWLSVIPTITGQPQSKSVSYGSATAVTVNANANGSVLHYQWFNYYTGAVVPGSGDSMRLALSSVTSPMMVYCRVTSGGATIQSYPAEVTTCSGPSVSLTVVPSGSCRMIYSNITGDYSGVEWYLGSQSDTSYWVGSQTSLYVCPSTTTTYWMRVYGPDGTCNADSVTVNAP
jgi:hypothetical protein